MNRLLIWIIVFVPIVAEGQRVIALQELIDLALKNNFDIQIARNDAEIDKIKNTYGYAGGLPVISGTMGSDGSLNHMEQQFSDGSSNTYNSAGQYGYDAGISGSMVLFNGMKIIATKQRLNALQQQSELLLAQEIQNTIAALSLKYYDIVRQQSYLKIIQSSQDFSKKKLAILNERDKVGMAKPADLLQLQMETNNAEQAIKLQELLIERDKADLLILAGEKDYTPFEINDTIAIEGNLQPDSLLAIIDKNPQFLLADNSIRIYEQSLREISAVRYPSLKINAGYQFSNAFYTYGTTESNRVFGPWAGVSLSVPIFNGNIYGIQKRAGVLNLENARLEKDKIYENLKSEVYKTGLSYRVTLNQIAFQKENYELAREIESIMLQNFQVNQATVLDMKEAQTLFENAAYLLINLQFSAKVAEIELKRLTGKISEK